MSTINQDSAGVVKAIRHIQSEVAIAAKAALAKPDTAAQFDSAATGNNIIATVLGGGDNGLNITSPAYAALQQLCGYLGKEAGYVMDSAARAMSSWRERFNQEVPDNVAYAGICRGLALYESDAGLPATDPLMQLIAREDKAQMDSASNQHHDQLSIRAGLALASLLSTLASATPFAGVVPFPMGSNEGKIVLVTPKANNDFGAYRAGDVLVGARAGLPFTMAGRLLVLTEADVTGGKSYVTTVRECVEPAPAVLPATGFIGWRSQASSPAERILSGRTVVLVNGIQVGGDIRTGNGAFNQNKGTTNLNGKFYVKGDAATEYTIDGTCDLDGGVIDFTIKPALPPEATVRTLAFIDWERQKSRTDGKERWASIGVETDGYSVYAEEARVDSEYTISAATQFQQELGMNIAALSMGAGDIYTQERYRRIIELGALVAAGNPQQPLDLNVAAQLLQKSVSESISDQIMMRIEQIETLFVTEAWSTKAGFVFIPTLLAPIFRRIRGFTINEGGVRAGIYLVGNLPNGLPVYSVPAMDYVFGSDETLETGSILICGGDNGDPARSPILIGDAIPMLPVNMNNQYNRDFEAAQGWYGRGLTCLNPNQELAGTWARLDITGMNLA